jgi:hypothetical protein
MWPLQESLRKGFIRYFPVNTFEARKEKTFLISRIEDVVDPLPGQQER